MRTLMTILFIVLASAHAPVLAQANWPERAIRIVTPNPPGGPSEIVTRAAMPRMQLGLKQPIVFETKPGAGGNLGTAEVARAAPDGYTWIIVPDTVLTINPHVYRSLAFKPEDLTPVTIVSQFTQTLVCNQALGVKTLAELVAKARAAPLSYASGGAGVPGHMAMELLASMAGVEMQHIPYKGPAPATQDVIGGQVPCGFLAGPTVLPHIRSGRLVALAVSGTRRSPLLPDVPTVAEAGYPGYDATFSLVLLAPRGTPEPIIAAFRKAFIDALKSDEAIERLKTTDQVVVGSSPAEAAAQLAARSATWREVARRIRLQLD